MNHLPQRNFLRTFKTIASINPPPQRRRPRRPYEIPDRYQNTFYLANASLYDTINWYLHHALEIFWPVLNIEYRRFNRHKQFSSDAIATKLEEFIKLLEQCNCVIDIRFPVQLDNGSRIVVRGFRAHHGYFTGYPVNLGGLRINENITRDHMKGLSLLGTYRNACMGIPLAGAHGGIKIDSRDYSENEMVRIVEGYARELYRKGFFGKTADIFHPDMGTNEKTMDVIHQSIAQASGQEINISAMGRSDSFLGYGDTQRTGALGAFYALDFLCNNHKLMSQIQFEPGLKDKTFIIQGLGKIGTNLAKDLTESGCVCVGVKDPDAYLYDAKGIDLIALLDHKSQYGSIEKFSVAIPASNDEIYKENCDILILAAGQKSLNCHYADKVQAKIILEAADGAVVPTAQRILAARQKLVIPDLYACSGMAISSYLEFLRTKQQINENSFHYFRFLRNVYKNILNSSVVPYQKQEEEVVVGNQVHKLESKFGGRDFLPNAISQVILSVGKEILDNTEYHNLGLNLRTAAYILAINEIFKGLYEIENKTI